MKKLTLAALALLPLTLACGDKDDTGAADDSGSSDPDLATAQDIWSEIAGYDGWNQTADWTGIQASADGTHGDYVQVWLNDTAFDTIDAAAGDDMPDGAIIVKEGYADSAGSTVNGVTVMKKISGFDADHSDWFWVKYQTDGTIDLYGSASGCYGCHTDGQDFVKFTTW